MTTFEICTEIANAFTVFEDNPNGGYEYTCPFCSSYKSVGLGVNVGMADIQHEEGCLYLKAVAILKRGKELEGGCLYKVTVHTASLSTGFTGTFTGVVISSNNDEFVHMIAITVENVVTGSMKPGDLYVIERGGNEYDAEQVSLDDIDNPDAEVLATKAIFNFLSDQLNMAGQRKRTAEEDYKKAAAAKAGLTEGCKIKLTSKRSGNFLKFGYFIKVREVWRDEITIFYADAKKDGTRGKNTHHSWGDEAFEVVENFDL